MPRPVIRLALFGLLAAPALGGAGCNRAKEAPPAPPPPKVSVVRPAVVKVQSYLDYNGTLDTTQSVEIRARVKGLLTKVYFVEGTEVRGPDPNATDEDLRRGARLFSIDDKEFKTAVRKAEAELAKAKADIGNWKAQIKLATAEVERMKKAGTAASKTELDKAEATLDVNEAELKAAIANEEAAAAALHSANIQLGYTDIRSPLAGRTSRTHVDEGNLVGQTDATLLTTVVRMDELYVLFDAPERDREEFEKKNPAAAAARKVEVFVGVTGELGYPHAGMIDFSENKVDTGTGTIRIRGRVPNPIDKATGARKLYPGLYARVRVPAGPEADRPVIPEEALMTGQEGRYVFVVGAENKVAKRTVTVGTQIYRIPPPEKQKDVPGWALRNPADPAAKLPPVRSMVAIDKGLGPDDVVIVDGLQRARPGAPVDPEAFQLVAPAAK